MSLMRLNLEELSPKRLALHAASITPTEHPNTEQGLNGTALSYKKQYFQYVK
jgi:hypothetical protein